MSRTDVHRPAWVQRRDTTLRQAFVLQHHHWEHECWDKELKRHLVVRSVPCDAGAVDARCQLWPRGRNLFCGCQLCVGRAGRRLTRRQERTRLRAQLRATVKTGPTDVADLDIPAPGPSTVW